MTEPDLTGLELPDVFPPAGTYRSAVLHGDVLHTAGHISPSLPAGLAVEVEATIAVLGTR